MSVYKIAPTAFTRKVRLLSLASAAVALAVYGLTLKHSLFPGECAALMVQWTGLDMLAFPNHPLWAKFLSFFAGGSAETLVVRVNVFSMICGVLSAALGARLAAHFVYQVIDNEETSPFAGNAALVAGGVTAFSFIFSSAIWQSATHLEYRIFDVLLALALFGIFPVLAARPRLTGLGVLLMGLGCGFGLAESAIFLALAPLYILATAVHCRKAQANALLWGAAFAIVAVITWLSYALAVGADFAALEQAAAAEYKSAGAVLFKLIDSVTHEFTLWFKRPKWLAVIILGVFPFLAAAFAALRSLNNERTWSGYIFHIGIDGNAEHL